MMDYALYLESGPMHKKTMVHVLPLLGCIAQGPTTDAALQATPQAIRSFLRFLQRQGEAVDPNAPFTTTVAEHVTEGTWLGNGNPTPGFAPDFQPLGASDLAVYLRRLAWLQSALADSLSGVTRPHVEAEPDGPGRTIIGIVQHVAEAHCAYLRYTVGKVDRLNDALRAVQPGADLLPALDRLWRLGRARMEMLTEDERTRVVQHGQVAWTAHRGLRRMLEHTWEHLLEIERRLAPIDKG
jgi:predicted RNase H-like HicB family nuclease